LHENQYIVNLHHLRIFILLDNKSCSISVTASYGCGEASDCDLLIADNSSSSQDILTAELSISPEIASSCLLFFSAAGKAAVNKDCDDSEKKKEAILPH